MLQHIVYAHGAYFMNKYGSLDIWSTQGMEKSHYRARGVYFKNTRHGGGACVGGIRTNYLLEMFNWFYRTTFGRVLARERAQQSKLAKEARKNAKKDAQDKWLQTNAPYRHAHWRARMRRQESSWVRRLPLE